jgi:hypothetical protein
MEKLDVRERRYQPLRRFPVSAFDISVVAGLREPAGDIERGWRPRRGAIWSKSNFSASTPGAPLPPDRKSVTYRLTVARRTARYRRRKWRDPRARDEDARSQVMSCAFSERAWDRQNSR